MIFIGGQIREGSRGNLAVLIVEDGQKGLSAFLESIGSYEYNQITGVRAAFNPLMRAYVGVSHEAGELLLRKLHYFSEGVSPPMSMDFSMLDQQVVYAHFLRKSNPEHQ